MAKRHKHGDPETPEIETVNDSEIELAPVIEDQPAPALDVATPAASQEEKGPLGLPLYKLRHRGDDVA